MTKYIVFAGKENQSIEKILGYINNWIDNGFVGSNTRKGYITKPAHIKLWFHEDEKIEKEFEKMNLPKRYFAIRLEVKDETSLKEQVPKFCSRYGLEYKVYDI
jgi:hypothetical protein